MLYEVVILEKPTKEEQLETLVAGPLAIVARDEKSAAVTAAIQLERDGKRLNSTMMEILVRPFE